MKENIEDYKRRLATVTKEIDAETKDDKFFIDFEKVDRLKTKQGEYNTIIAELQRTYRKYITQKLDVLMEDHLEDRKGGGSGKTLRIVILVFVEVAKDMGIEVDVDFVESTYTIK